MGDRSRWNSDDLDALSNALATVKTRRLTATQDAPETDRHDVRIVQEVRREIGLRRRRDALVGSADEAAFGEPGWDILLDLYQADGSRNALATLSIARGANIAPSSLLRWLAVLTERGWITRTRDTFDRRRVSVCLTPAGRSLVERCFPER
jgi:MarR family transcriptional regulator, temperature-dependent positive regulator of motility